MKTLIKKEIEKNNNFIDQINEKKTLNPNFLSNVLNNGANIAIIEWHNWHLKFLFGHVIG